MRRAISAVCGGFYPPFISEVKITRMHFLKFPPAKNKFRSLREGSEVKIPCFCRGLKPDSQHKIRWLTNACSLAPGCLTPSSGLWKTSILHMCTPYRQLLQNTKEWVQSVYEPWCHGALTLESTPFGLSLLQIFIPPQTPSVISFLLPSCVPHACEP